MDWFKSKDFNPIQALANTNLNIEEGEEHESIYALRAKAQETGLKATSSDIEGVSGPGGFPVAKGAPHRTTHDQGRIFHQVQEPVAKRPPKRLRNVLLRMDEMTGPLAVLRSCRDSNTKVKVYTRNHSEVRGIMTGYVVAFDKYWNLVLRDVVEVFQKKISYKTVSLQNIESYVNVADLSIKSEDEEFQYRSDFKGVWLNPFQQRPSTFKECKPEAAATPPSTSFRESSKFSPLPKREKKDFESHLSKARGHRPFVERSGHTSTTALQEWRSVRGRDKKKTEGLRIDTKSLKKNSSQHNDVSILQRSHHYRKESERNVEKERIKDEPSEGETNIREEKGDLNKELVRRDMLMKELQELEDVNELEQSKEGDEEETDDTEAKPKRKRRRKKLETRERHVKQLLIRGETVVLINVLQV